MEHLEGRLVRRKVTVQASEETACPQAGTAAERIVTAQVYFAGSRLRCVALAVALGERWDRRTPRHGGPRMMGYRLKGCRLPWSGTKLYECRRWGYMPLNDAEVNKW